MGEVFLCNEQFPELTFQNIVKHCYGSLQKKWKQEEVTCLGAQWAYLFYIIQLPLTSCACTASLVCRWAI